MADKVTDQTVVYEYCSDCGLSHVRTGSPSDCARAQRRRRGLRARGIWWRFWRFRVPKWLRMLARFFIIPARRLKVWEIDDGGCTYWWLARTEEEARREFVRAATMWGVLGEIQECGGFTVRLDTHPLLKKCYTEDDGSKHRWIYAILTTPTNTDPRRKHPEDRMVACTEW